MPTNLNIGVTLGSGVVASSLTPQQRGVINAASRPLNAALVAREFILREKFRQQQIRNDATDPIDVQRQASLFRYQMDNSFTAVRGVFALKSDPDQYMQFQFNPEEIQDEKSVEYTDRSKTGRDEVDYIWIKGGPRVLTFKLIFDATLGSKVRHLGKSDSREYNYATDDFTHNPDRGTLNQVEFLQGLMRPFIKDKGVAQNKVLAPRYIRGGAVQGESPFANPSEVIFVYGPFYLEGIVTAAPVTHQLWDRNLIPLRSEAQVTFRVKEGGALNINSAITRIAGTNKGGGL